MHMRKGTGLRIGFRRWSRGRPARGQCVLFWAAVPRAGLLTYGSGFSISGKEIRVTETSSGILYFRSLGYDRVSQRM